jgi:3alpha(or 20beta)-hydroxysteroid dehydrogenase
MKRLEGKIAIVTGAARGLGASIARLFVEQGARVVVADVSDAARTLADTLGENAHYVELDVASESGWQAAIESTRRRFGNPTVLVNNAGIYRLQALESLSLDDYMQVVRINQVGCFLGMRSVIEPMKAAGGGSIVNVSSTSGLQGQAGALAYVASKFAVRGMTKAAALELAPFAIRVNSVHPGAIATPLVAEAYGAPSVEALVAQKMPTVPLGRMAQADELARLVLFLASDEASYSTGSEFVADGGLTAGSIAARLQAK